MSTSRKGEAETIPLSVAATRLGIDVRAARKAALAGELPAIRINGRWRILTDCFNEMLGAQTFRKDRSKEM